MKHSDFFIYTCHQCGFPVTAFVSFLKISTHKYIACSRCGYIFNTQQLPDFLKLNSDSYSISELLNFLADNVKVNQTNS